MGRRSRHNLHQTAGPHRGADFRIPGTLLTGNRHRVTLRDIFAAGVAFEKIVVRQRETLFKMIPKLTGDRRLHAQIPPVVIKRIAGKLGFLVGGATGYQIRPLAARGIVHIPVHQLAHARHLWPLRQRRVRIRGRFINAEGILLAQALRGYHRVEAALLHQAVEDLFGFIITTALHQQVGLPVAPFIFLFGVHRQTCEPGIQPPAIAGTQRHAHAALHQRRGVRTHNGIISPACLFVGHIRAHQSPCHDITQLLGLIVI